MSHFFTWQAHACPKALRPLAFTRTGFRCSCCGKFRFDEDLAGHNGSPWRGAICEPCIRRTAGEGLPR